MIWPSSRLLDACLTITDGTHGSPERAVAGGVPVLSAQNVRHGSLDLTTDRFTTQAELAVFNKRILPTSGDVLVTIVGTIGRSALLGSVEPFVFQRSVALLRPDPAKLDGGYLKRALDSQDFQAQLARASNTSTQAGVYLGRLGELSVPLPPLPEQRRIASILDQIDELRVQRRLSLTRLDSFRDEYFVAMFGDVVANPRDWNIATVGDLVSGFSSGKSVAAVVDSADSKYRVLKISAVTKGTFDPRESKPLHADYAPPISHIVEDGDLLFSRANTADLVGATAVVRGANAKLLLSDKLWRFMWAPGAHGSSTFLWRLFWRPEFRRLISDRATGSSGSMKNITQSAVLSLPIIVPPVDVREKFGSTFDLTEDLKDRMEAHLVVLDELFASLQHQVFWREL